ncbi:MAG: Asp-tRNA(Asn)/Glu-tRNA(Gln) amidotransferase subunit GatC, partial [Halobacteria archaeon]|nr:Asp-tRNA(Asn)/Glu-tRNA(Gln) amidotransferase subunit GatC [Halobacteria archaeon]
MSVDSSDVEHIAELARIKLDEGDVDEFVDEFNEILDYFDTLDEIPDEVDIELERLSDYEP